jgi:glycerol kinase
MGVAGQVFGLDGSPITGMQVHVTGMLGDQTIDKLGLTGAATQYGAGEYYEVQLGNQAIASENTLQVTLLDSNGTMVSNPEPFSTTTSCQENLVLINFSQIP